MGTVLPYREYPIALRAGASHIVAFGTEPAGVSNGVRALFLPGAGIASLGNARLFAELSRRLAAEGYETLRVDLPGVGESSGATKLPEPEGHSVRGALAAFVGERQPGHGPTVVVGECLGAWAALEFTGMPGVHYMVLLWPPLTAGTECDRMAGREAGAFTSAVAEATGNRIVVYVTYGNRDLDLPRFDATMSERFGVGYRSSIPNLQVIIEEGKLHGIASRGAAIATERIIRLALAEALSVRERGGPTGET
jgi:hypothetical protein